MIRKIWARVGRRKPLLIVVALLVIIVIVGASSNSQYRTLGNLLNVLEQSVPLGLVSLGQTLVILTGGIDLSIGSLINLTSSVTSGTVSGDGSLVFPVVGGVLLLGALIGCISGLLVVGLRVHPVIVTLGMGTMLQGVTLVYSLHPIGAMPIWFKNFAYGRVLGIPAAAIMLVVLFVLVGLFLKRIRLGRYIYAVGGNMESARLSGISTKRVLVFVYAACGFFAALCGIYLVSRLGLGDPWMGRGWELNSITPVVVGGTILAGGRGGVLGTLLGVFLISALNNLLNFLGFSSFYQWIVQGVIIIVAVSLYVEKRIRT
jgi:ribose transport system permease protein